MAGNDQKPSGNVDSAVRERLLRAAVDSFAAFGFEGSSLRTIAQQAGVAFQLITYYFGSKEDLWMAAVDYLFASRFKSSQVTLDPDADFPQQLRTWVHTAIAMSIREPQLRQIMCQEFLAHSERYDKHIRVQARENAASVTGFLDQAQRRGQLTRFSSREMLLIMRGFVIMATVSPDDIVSLVGGRIDNERTIDLLTDLICNLFLRGEGIPALKQIAAVASS
jgi:TetR/AcrR family transcriptional regulator